MSLLSCSFLDLGEHRRQKFRVRRMRPQLPFPGPELELAVIFFCLFLIEETWLRKTG